MTSSTPTRLDPDLEAVRKTQGGMTAAFEGLVVKYQDGVFNAASRMLGDREEAAEVTQEVFLKVYRSIGAFRADSLFSTYLWRTLINYVTSVRRRREVRRDMKIVPFGSPGNDSAAVDPPDRSSDGPAQLVSRAEVDEAIRRAIAALEEPFRSVVVLRDMEGLEYEAISDILDTPIGTVKSRLHRGRCQLREMLEAYI